MPEETADKAKHKSLRRTVQPCPTITQGQTTILKAGNEVSDALVNYNQYDANSKIEAQRVEALAKAVDATIELYHSKGITYLEVLTAQSQLLSAQLTLAADDFNKMQSVVSLYTALGGGGK